MLSLLALATVATAQSGVEIAQITVRSRVVIRVQTGPAGPPPVVTFRERKGPRCLAMTGLMGAAVVERNSVDFIMRGGTRVRARFATSCPTLDYYTGFYIVPPADGQMCADREVVHTRAGGECTIDRFRLLVPKESR